MKKNLLLSLIIVSFKINAQVPKKVIVEHFTNTKCSSCASRNPGLYSNLSAQTNVIHLAIHPSSPYSSCALSFHNPTENDARTNYYGIYGGTPRIVIQGSEISSGANYGSSSIFTPFLNQTSPVSLKIYQSKYGSDSIKSRIVIKTMATNTLTNIKLFVALAEDTISFNGGNGELKHYDVFRKALTSTSGGAVTIPAIVGDSSVYTYKSASNAAWNFSRIFTIAVLQNGTTKEVVQSQSVSAKTNNITTAIFNLNNQSNISVYVRYDEKNIVINNFKNEISLFTLYDLAGKKIINQTIDSTVNTLNTNGLTSGMYLYSITSKDKIVKTGKLILN